jgi:hypothetical protein
MLSKESALRFARKWTPLYAEVFQDLKSEGGRVKIYGRFAKIRSNVASYVQLYDDERKPGVSILIALIGEEGFKKLNEGSATWAEREVSEFIEEFASDDTQDELLQELGIPETEAEWIKQEQEFQALPEEQKAASIKTSSFFWSGFFAQFFNTLSLMTHGATLITLVKQALADDDEAFCKAVQVDRFLLSHHPFFIARKQRAQDEGDTEFLSALAYRESNPNLKGKIRYPALFMLFGVLESVKWLDKLKHEEILDLCDEIGLDRFQNRIEDVNYLTKRLADYRRFQKSGGLSMR